MSQVAVAPPIYNCEVCEKEGKGRKTRGGFGIPSKWTKLDDKLYCPKCKSKEFVPRSLHLQVASVMTKNEDGEWKPDWQTFREIFWKLERDAVRVANWAIGHYYNNDPMHQIAPDEKFPRYTLPYLYGNPRIEQIGPSVRSKVKRELLHAAGKLYRKMRFEVFIGKHSSPTFRSNNPIPVGVLRPGNKEWDLISEGDVHFIEFSLEGTRFRFRLMPGKRHRYQIAGVRKMLTGEFTPRFMSILNKTGGRQNHRPQAGRGKRLVLSISYLKHRRQIPEKDKQQNKVLYISTAPDVFLRYGLRDDPEQRLVYHARHIQRRRMAHRRRLDSLMDDRKRVPRGAATNDRRDINVAINKLSAKERRRNQDFIHKTSRWLIDFGIRNKVVEVIFDGGNEGYIQEFPWYLLGKMLEHKAIEAGMSFSTASSDQ